MEKINPIILTMEDGTEYTLEFSRSSVDYAERMGFNIDELGKYMMIRLPELFFFAFRMHHPRMTKKQTDKILFEDLGGISPEMIDRLGDLYQQGYEALVGDPSKNSKVTITM